MNNTKEELEKKIKKNILPIKEGLLKFDELNDLSNEILNFISNKTNGNNLWQLRLRKFAEKYNKGSINTDSNDYASSLRTSSGQSGWDYFEPFVNIFFQFINEIKIVKWLEDSELWVESRTDANTTHLFIGNKHGDKRKVQLIFGETGEIRIDKKDSAPSDLLNKIESKLITKEGKIIKSVLEFE